MLTITLFTFAATFVAILLLRRYAAGLRLVDHPGGHKTHASPTPVVGGLAMGLVLLVPWSLPDTTLNPAPAMLFGAMAIMALGVWDDTRNMKPRFKLLWQMLIVALVFALAGSPLQTLGNLFPFTPDLQLGMLALPMAVFGALGLINGVNMLDGIDGLAGSVVFVALFWLTSCCLFATPNIHASGEILVLMAALAAFLLFNLRLPGLPRARIFMGDTGSMLLGFALTVIAIDMTQQHGMPPVTALWICALPVLDTTAVTLNRLMDKRQVNVAGRDHLHHLLAARGFSVNQIVGIESLVAFACGAIGVAGWHLAVPEWLMFQLFVGTAIVYTLGFRRVFEQTGTVARPAAEPATAGLPALMPAASMAVAAPAPAPSQRGKVAVAAVALASLGGALVSPGDRSIAAEPEPSQRPPAEAEREPARERALP